jgi:hypothetical protein
MSGDSERLPLWDRILLRVSAWLLLMAGFLWSVGRRHRQAEEVHRGALERHPGS